MGFVFDKIGGYSGQINLICFVFQAYIVYRRNLDAIIYNTSVFYASIFYETFSLWIYLIIGIHLIAGSALSLTTVLLIFLAGIGISCSAILY